MNDLYRVLCVRSFSTQPRRILLAEELKALIFNMNAIKMGILKKEIQYCLPSAL